MPCRGLITPKKGAPILPPLPLPATDFNPNARRTHLDLGAEPPLLPLFYIFVKVPLPYPLEPSLPRLRLAFDLRPPRV